MKAYLDRPWGAYFQSRPWPLSHERILEAVAAQAGSIGKPSANALGIGVGALRRLIEETGLESKVNALRKKFRRVSGNQYLRSRLTSLPWMRTLSGPKMRVSYAGFAASSAIDAPRLRRRLSVASSSSIRATTMSPVSA